MHDIPDQQGSPHVREGRIIGPPRMQAAGLQCLKLQIAVSFPREREREIDQRLGQKMTDPGESGRRHPALCAAVLHCRRCRRGQRRSDDREDARRLGAMHTPTTVLQGAANPSTRAKMATRRSRPISVRGN